MVLLIQPNLLDDGGKIEGEYATRKEFIPLEERDASAYSLYSCLPAHEIHQDS